MLKKAKRWIARRRLRSELGEADPGGIVARVRERHLSYLSDRKFLGILRAIDSIEVGGVPGTFLEAGCALGGSAIVIADHMAGERRLEIYDVFGQIPPPTSDDPKEVHERYDTITRGLSSGIGGDVYYGYVPDLKNVVDLNLRSLLAKDAYDRVSLVEGMVQDTLKPQQPVAFIHIDVDWYEPVLTCLERVYPMLGKGGTIVLDDYYDWGGCKKATDKFLSEHAGEFVTDGSYGNFILKKT